MLYFIIAILIVFLVFRFWNKSDTKDSDEATFFNENKLNNSQRKYLTSQINQEDKIRDYSAKSKLILDKDAEKKTSPVEPRITNEIESTSISYIDEKGGYPPLQIEYKDIKKEITTREINIQNYYYDNKNRLMINAYCDLRNDFRTFIGANILKVTNCDTGEIIDSIYELIPRPQVSAQQIIKEYEHEINILMFIARADGYLRAKERKIIEIFIRSKTEYELSEDINNIIRKLDCNVNTFQKSVKKLQSKSFEDRQSIIKLMEDIIYSDKNTTDIELSILKELKEKFFKKNKK